MKISSGILAYRNQQDDLEYLLVRLGEPLYKNKNMGIWTIPKSIVKKHKTYYAYPQQRRYNYKHIFRWENRRKSPRKYTK